MSSKPTYIALFPYVFFDSDVHVRIDGLVLKSAYEPALNSEHKTIRDSLMTVRQCFRAHRRKELPIVYWSYAVLNVTSQLEFDDSIKMLSRASDILRFVALSRGQDRSLFSNFNYWLFQLDPKMKLDGSYVYLEAFMNGIERSDFDMKNGVAANPFLPQESLTPQLIRVSELEENLYFAALYRNHNFLFREAHSREKLVRAIEWFNRSFSHGERGVDVSEAIMNVHSALEALLRPKAGSSVKAEVRTGLMTLLGDRSEISEWFNSFHDLRNSLVHGDVAPQSFLYRRNRSHLLLARKVFLACLNLILHAARELPLLGFEDELRTNESRINETIKNLKSAQKKKWTEIVEEDLLNPLGGLRNDDISSPKIKTVEVGKLLLPHVRDELVASNLGGALDSTIAQIDIVVGWSSPDLGLLALAYSNLELSYQQLYFDQHQSPDQLSLRTAAYPFVHYATWRLLVFRE